MRMREDSEVPRFTPPTPNSRRLGRRLRRLREERGLTQEEAARLLACSQGRIGRIESGDIKPRPRDVLEILVAYGVPHEQEPGRGLLEMARQLREPGWWQGLSTLPNRYITYMAYEAEAAELRHFEPMAIPSLMQTRAYAEEINRVGRETESELIAHRVEATALRQEVLTTRRPALRMHAIVTEVALMLRVGGTDVMVEQLELVARLAARPNITVQVLRLAAGAHLAVRGGFAILSFDQRDPSLGYIETVAGELFLESADEVRRLNGAYEGLQALALSPSESVKFVQTKVLELSGRHTPIR
ncbi:helix-turn-helix transcriptional regulator [Rugosimonospora acidiphila]|uniref:Helix-turn-helix transcriptional regulator n=1 Tax=Rugosimonospora acidiphila TaxID=556531 RepID=A0ABP9RGQ6_9ACTN